MVRRSAGMSPERSVGMNLDRSARTSQDRSAGMGPERSVGMNLDRSARTNQDKSVSRFQGRSVIKSPGSHAILNIDKSVLLSTDRLLSTNLSKSAIPSRIRLKDRSLDRFVTRLPDRPADRFQLPRQNTDLKLVVILLLSRGVLKYPRRLATIINVFDYYFVIFYILIIK